MRIRDLALVLSAGAFCVLLMPIPAMARAGVDVDLGLSVPVGDDGRLWLEIASRSYDYEPRVVERFSARYTNPDDLAVGLFIARTSGRDPDAVFGLRSQRLSWWDVGVRVGVPVDAWYVPVERDPGPPYGKAYGHWKKHRADPHHVVVLSDRQARHLVAARMAHAYYGVPVEIAMEWRRDSRDVREMMCGEYRRRHGHHDRDGSGSHGDHDDDGKHAKSKGHGKGHGK